MITVKNKAAILKMERAGQLLVEIFDMIPSVLRVGMTSLELDSWIATQLASRNLESQSKGYMGYRHVSCISVNDEVVHGVPNAKTVFADGDLIKVDVCAAWNGYCADMARSFYLGTPSAQQQELVRVAQSALDKGIAVARAGNRLSDISAAIHTVIPSSLELLVIIFGSPSVIIMVSSTCAAKLLSFVLTVQPSCSTCTL